MIVLGGLQIRASAKLVYTRRQAASALFCVGGWNRFQEMRRHRFFSYFLLQLLVIIAVMALFHFNSDKKTASVQAGFLFVLLPIVLISVEVLGFGYRGKLWLFGMIQFWFLFALPILTLRLMNWDADFSSLSYMGIPGPVLHQWSSKSYLLMMAITLIEAWRLHKSKKPV